MENLTKLLTSLKDVTQQCLRYVELKSKNGENLEHSDVINEYYGAMEAIAQQISTIFDEKNNLDLIANTALMDGVSKIVEFFSSVSNDQVLDKSEVEELQMDRIIDMAQKQKQE